MRMIKIGEYLINSEHITSIYNDPQFTYADGTGVGRFIIYTLRPNEDITVPYSIMPFLTFVSKLNIGIV